MNGYMKNENSLCSLVAKQLFCILSTSFVLLWCDSALSWTAIPQGVSHQPKKKMHRSDPGDALFVMNAEVSALMSDVANTLTTMPLAATGNRGDRYAAISNDTVSVHNDSPDVENEYREEIEFSLLGMVELENYIHAEKDQEPDEANKKNELRNRLKLRVGFENLYLYVVNNLYVHSSIVHDPSEDYHYSEKTEVARNLRISSRDGEATFNELYFNCTSGRFRIRIGNQLYAWGTADAFNPTSYFNPYDARELLLKDDDEIKAGVPSLSALVFLDGYSLELVCVPVHIPMILPGTQNFWYLDFGTIPFSVDLEETDGLELAPGNAGYGARFTGTVRGIDFSLSGYHGPDREAVLMPYRTVLIPDEPISLRVAQQHYIINMIGFDLSSSFDKFVIQCEAAFSPDKRGLVEPEDTSSITLPFKVASSSFISYAAGFNYFVPLSRILKGHEGETVFTLEWSQSRFFDDKIASPLISDIIICRIEDSYFSGRVPIAITAMIGTRERGYIFWPKLGYDFQNGLTIEIAYVNIIGSGEDDSPFDYSIFNSYRDKDIVMWSIRYVY